MKTTRTLSLAAIAATAALALAACGGGGTADPTITSAAATTEAASDSVTIGITQIVDHPSLNAARDGFMAALKDAGIEATYDAQNAQGDQSVAASIAGNFAAAKVDLVLAVATPTAQAAAQALTDIPVLFTAVTDPEGAGLVASNDAPGANVTGTSDANPIFEQLELVKLLVPDAQTVGIVYSSAEQNSAVQVAWAEEAAAELGLTIVTKTVSTSNEVQQAVESLDVDAIYVPTDNTVVSALETVLGVAEARKIPVIAAEGDSVARGAIATYGISYYDLGYQTGEMAVRILKGEGEPASMPVETQSNLLVYLNLGAAERMGVEIPQSLLDQAKPENVTK